MNDRYSNGCCHDTQCGCRDGLFGIKFNIESESGIQAKDMNFVLRFYIYGGVDERCFHKEQLATDTDGSYYVELNKHDFKEGYLFCDAQILEDIDGTGTSFKPVGVRFNTGIVLGCQCNMMPTPPNDGFVNGYRMTFEMSGICENSEKPSNPCEDCGEFVTAESCWERYFSKFPELVADRAVADENGNRITDTYITRNTAAKYIASIFNTLFTENPPLITNGYITPEMLSEETREMLEATGQNITNLPDGEDLASVHGVLKLANKEHNPNTYSGLGRQYLRKNIVAGVNVLTQSMMSKPNTIYIIQYDYDLQGAEITIPEGCVLDFQGGSLSNGIINSDDVIIKADYKIFNNIFFTGNIKDNLRFSVNWFVKGTTNIEEKEDSTSDLQRMFDLGVINLHFESNLYYYITKTIVINHVVNITGSPYRERGNNEVRAIDTQMCSSIFTDKRITMIEYNHPTSESNYAYRPVNIGGFNLLSMYDYSNDSEMSYLPLLLVKATSNNNYYSPIWGIKIDTNISNYLRTAFGNPQPCPNMVGIKFIARGEGSYITYIKIDGYIQGVISGFDTESEDGAWITTVEDYSDKNWIVQVCRCNASPLFINGQNQNGYNRYKNLFPNVAFVEGGNVTLNGTLWDVPINRVAVKCHQFVNNCPTLMGQVLVDGNNGYSPYHPTSIAEIPYQGKSNNILEGLTYNAQSPLSKKLYNDIGYNSISAIRPIKDYNIELFDSSNVNNCTSVKGQIKDELNIFNSEYLGLIKEVQGKYVFSGYNNIFDNLYGNNTSLRYSFVLSDIFCIDHSAYILTHTGNFETVKIKIEYRNINNEYLNEEIIKETTASDYYRNVFYTQIGKLKGSDAYNNLHSGYSRLIVEYINITGRSIYPPIGLFNSTYKGLGVSGGNIVGRVNIQDVVHATPSTPTMDIYYAYNKNYGQNMTINNSYTRLFRCKYRFNHAAKLYFSFRTGHNWNYTEIIGENINGDIGDNNVTVKVNLYRSETLIYADVYAKSAAKYNVEFGKLFCTYGVEFIDDDSTEVDSLEIKNSSELKSTNHNRYSSTISSGLNIVKIKVPKGPFSGICVNGGYNYRTISVINLSANMGSDGGKPLRLVMENIANSFDSNSAHSPIAYYDVESDCNVIELTQFSPNYSNAFIFPIDGNIISTECVNMSSYDSSKHSYYIEGILIKNTNSGTFANKPSACEVGFSYFCTDKQSVEGGANGLIIYYKGEDVWVDALGRVVE